MFPGDSKCHEKWRKRYKRQKHDISPDRLIVPLDYLSIEIIIENNQPFLSRQFTQYNIWLADFHGQKYLRTNP